MARDAPLPLQSLQWNQLQWSDYDLNSPADLSILRGELRQSWHADGLVMQRSICERTGVAIEGVEMAVMDPRFGRDYYRYDPELMTDPPHFSHE